MENLMNELKFDEKGLIPVVTQDSRTDEVLMVAYMNKEALQKSIESGKVHYWSRSRNSLWLKGETSGHYQIIKSISYDCDSDALLVKAEQKGAACHTGHHSCFYRKLDGENMHQEDTTLLDAAKAEESNTAALIPNDSGDISKVLQELYNVIADRKINPKEGSYTNYLFSKGLDKILKKVGEETAEVIIAAKNSSKDEIKGEVADLMYHLCVLMVESGVNLNDIYEELKERR